MTAAPQTSFQRLARIAAEQTSRDISTITAAAVWYDIGLDNVDLLEVHMMIESEFDIVLDPWAIELDDTIAITVAAIDAALGRAAE